MIRIAMAVTWLLAPFALQAQAPDFTGTYEMEGDQGTVVLGFAQSGANRYSGQMSNSGLVWELQGDIYEDALIGTVDTGQGFLAFEAHINATGLELVLVGLGTDGQPETEDGTAFIFTRSDGRRAGAGPSAEMAEGSDAQGPGEVQERDASVARPATPGWDPNSPLAGQWRAHLAGKKVTYIDSYTSNTPGGGGFSTKFVYHLCSDGRFAFSGSDVVSLNENNPDILGGGSAGGNQGTWQVASQGGVAGIELRFNSGQVDQYILSLRNGETYVNEMRVYVTPGEVCN